MQAVRSRSGRGVSLRRLGRDTSGANMIEAAIITPLLLLLTLAIVDFSAMFYAYLALEHGVSQATRYAVTGQQMSASGSPIGREASIKAKMREATPTLTIPDGAFSFSFMSPGSSSWSGGLGGPNDIGRVTVNYNWVFMTPLIRPFFPGGQINLSVQSTMKNEAIFD